MKKEIYYSSVAEFLQKDFNGINGRLESYSTLDKINPNTLVFAKVYKESIVEKLNEQKNLLAIVTPEYQGKIGCSYICSTNPRLDYLRVISHFFVTSKLKSGIHPSAIIEQGAKIGKNVCIGANCYIGSEVVIGENTEIHHNVVIIGKVTIGDNCYIKSGAIIGEEGFGFEINENGIPEHFPHTGSIRIGNNVFIGANTTIEIGTIGITIIEDNVKVDDLVQIGHNSSTGMNTLITVGSILCGGVVVEENCYVAPNVTIREKVHVARNSFLGMGTVVIRDVDAGSTIIGNPGRLLIK